MAFVHRPIIFSDAGMVVSGHHRASEVGADVLKRGGTAIEAAAATSAALCVSIPYMNGIGGDCFALYFNARDGKVSAINGSGATPRGATAEFYRLAGHQEIPSRGPLSISTCGLVHAWQAALDRFGGGPLAPLLEPAIAIAEQGIPVDLGLQDYLSSEDYAKRTAAAPELARIYGPRARHELGARLKQQALAGSLRRIATEGVASFYGGALGKDLIADLSAAGAILSLDDLAKHETIFTASGSAQFHGTQVHFAPPNSQGIALGLLAGLWDILRTRPEAGGGLNPRLYMQIKRLAFKYRDQYAIDPARIRLPENLLGRERLTRMLDEESAPFDFESRSAGGDTSTFVIIDRWGNAVSWVQSLFEDFGSGVVSASTGIVMHNRLCLERLDASAEHGLMPGMRPFHTLCPALVIRDGCEMAIATPGDHGQPQSIFQVLVNVYENGQNLQAAIEAPRMRHDAGLDFIIEDRAAPGWFASASAAGFLVRKPGPWSRLLGGVNAVMRLKDGTLMSGADPRRSSYAVSAN